MGTFSPEQFLLKQAIGSIIAAFFVKKRRRVSPPAGDSNYHPPIYDIAGIPMTAITEEAYQLRSEVTNHPVETGVNFSDHIIQRPLLVDVTFEVGNFDGVGRKAIQAKKSLDAAFEVWNNRQPFTLMTTHRILENMVCRDIAPTNEAPEWGKLRFRATFQQINTVNLQTISFEVPAEKVAEQPDADIKPNGPATPKAMTKTVNTGTKAPRTATSRLGAFGVFKQVYGNAGSTR